jgi:hypothetical protein
MKKTGITIFVIGLLFTVFSGFGFFTKKKVVDIGKIEIISNEPHRLIWSPYLGVGIMMAGGIILLVGAKKLS